MDTAWRELVCLLRKAYEISQWTALRPDIGPLDSRFRGLLSRSDPFAIPRFQTDHYT